MAIPKPYVTLWGATAPTFVSNARNGLTLRQRFDFTQNGSLWGLKYAQSSQETVTQIVVGFCELNGDSTKRRAVIMRKDAPVGAGVFKWRTSYFHPGIPVLAGDFVRVDMCFDSRGGYWSLPGQLAAADYVNGPISVLGFSVEAPVIGSGLARFLPNTATTTDLLAVDVIFLPS